MKSPFDIIKRPIITEKATDAKDLLNKITFSVDPKASKMEIKKALEQVFKVEIEKVNLINVKGKVKKIGRQEGRRPGWKKAIATLKKGHTIEVFDQV